MIKRKASELAVGDVIDFAGLPPFPKHAFMFGKVDGITAADGTVTVDIEYWGEYAFFADNEFSVLNTEDMEAKLKALHEHFDSWPCDGWSVKSDKEHGRPSRETIQITYAHEYGEPGYTNPERAILFGNWNYVSKGVGNWLEEQGFELEWEDEWITLNDGKAYRTSPNSYDWTPSYVMDEEGNYYTKDDHDGTIEALAMTDKGHPARLLPDWVTDDELKAEGFVKVEGDDREIGWHPGQKDTPLKDAVPLFDKGAEAVVFRHTEQSQFYIKWDVWAKWPEKGTS